MLQSRKVPSSPSRHYATRRNAHVLPCSFTPLSSTNGKTAAYYEPRSVMHTKVARCAEPNSAHKYCVECSVHMMPAGIAGSGSPPEEPFRQIQAGICDLQCSAELYFPQSQPASRASSLAAEVTTIPKLACTLYAVGITHPDRPILAHRRVAAGIARPG